jgi:ubiquinone/menaquinone biosynthesis C-methylase UbiE
MKNSEALRIVRQTRANYNTIAAEWDVSRNNPSGLKLRLIKPVKPGWQVLDDGCGNGFMTPEILKLGANFTGIDLSGQLIKIAKKKYLQAIKSGQAKFIQGDAVKLPFPKNSFDFVFSFAVMHHIPSAKLRLKFLREIRRVLKPGAGAVIVNWNLLSDWERNKYNIDAQIMNCRPGHDKGDVHVPWKATKNITVSRYLHVFSRKELTELAKNAGFKNIRIDYRDRSGKLKKIGEEQVLKIKK